MENNEMEKRILINRYYELKLLVKPLIGVERTEKIFSNNLINCTIDEIKQIIVEKLNVIEKRISTGVFMLIKLEYRDLISEENLTSKTLSKKPSNIYAIKF